jgi:hypothetical protein
VVEQGRILVQAPRQTSAIEMVANAIGRATPLARKAPSLIISLRLNLRNNPQELGMKRYRVFAWCLREPEATPSANNVILRCDVKAEMGRANWPFTSTSSMVLIGTMIWTTPILGYRTRTG